MSYNDLRHLADSYGLAAMLLVYLVLVGWAFRPGSRRHNDAAANMIFTEDGEGQARDKERTHD
ncbi:MAG: cbb3-type cytochrome c oxidase subunit 3 [Sphingomonadales bacterium]|mgnify:CR=1 FL=1|nr:cbb3-type cytochrome c oxidase subunit 3 [Sphingomonadales bacterium]